VIDADKFFVGGLSPLLWEMTKESLHYHFEQYGPVMLVEVMRDWNTGDFHGFPFCGIYGYIKMFDLVMSHEGNAVSLLFCDFKSVFSFH
jgi:RNA recognition motif-containing protein